MEPSEFEALIHQSNDYLKSQNDSCAKDFQLDRYDRYDWDQWRGELIFSNDGVPKVVAKIQFVGSVSTKSNTWLWAWDNPSFLEPVKREVLAVKEFGTRHALRKLTSSTWKAEEVDGWEMTGVAARLLESRGAYRSPDEDGFTFMLFSEIAWAQGRSRVFATFACTHVLDLKKPVRLVMKEPDGDVQFLCGGVHRTSKDARVVHLRHLLENDRTLEALADLPIGWQAERTEQGGDWTRTPIPR